MQLFFKGEDVIRACNVICKVIFLSRYFVGKQIQTIFKMCYFYKNFVSVMNLK